MKVLFLLVGVFWSGIALWAREIPHPQIITDEVVLFEAGPDHPALKVKTGDIAVRLGQDAQIAVGTYPVPKSFRADLLSPWGSNWSLYREAYTKVGVLGLQSPYVFGAFLNSLFKVDSVWETGILGKQEGIPAHLRFTASKVWKMRGQNRPLVFDVAEPGSPEALAHARIPDFKENYYRLNTLDESLLDRTMHYYPQTPFLSHAGLIVVEQEQGRPVIYIYDAVPGDKGSAGAEDDGYKRGVRKVLFSRFFGPDEANGGAVLEVPQANAVQRLAAAEAVWKVLADLEKNETEDLFDYSFDWRQRQFFSCAALVWRSYAEGAGINIVSNLSLALVPAWVIRMKTEYDIKLNLQIAPQTLAQSLYTRRMFDFDSESFASRLEQLGKAEGPVSLPSRMERNPETGHFLFWSSAMTADKSER